MNIKGAYSGLRWRTALQVLGTVACVVALAWFVNWTLLKELLVQSPSSAIGTLLLFISAHVLSGMRLTLLAQASGLKLDWQRAQLLTLAGGFLSNILPSTIGGDAFRAYRMQSPENSWPKVIACLALDRVLNLFAVGTTFVIVIAVRLDDAASMIMTRHWSGLNLLLSTGVVGGFILIAWVAYRRMPGLRPVIHAIPRVTNIQGVIILFAAFIISAGSLWAIVLGQWILAHALGIEITLSGMALMVGLVYFTLLVPFTINGVGVQEAGIVTLLVHAGFDDGRAIAFAAMVRMMLVLSTAPGIVALGSIKRKKRPFALSESHERV